MDIIFKNKKLKILITGGAGFIGGCLVKKLLDHSDATIFNLDKLTYASDLSQVNKSLNLKRHNLLKVDLVNYEQLKKALNKSDPDLIFHLAAESHVDRSIDNSKPFIESNIIGTFNILELAKIHWQNLSEKRRENFRFIHVSTDEVFGSLGLEGTFNEKTAYDPRSPYSASKASSDHLANAWFHTYNFPIIKTNCSNNFGPYQFPEKLIPLIIIKALNNEIIPIYGDGENIRDWLYVEDHVNALLLAANKGVIGNSYCIGGNNEKTNLEIVNCICEILDKKLPKEKSYKRLIRFVEDRPGHDKRYAIDSAFIRKELGWKPNFNFKESLNLTVEWYLKNKDWINNIQSKVSYKGERLGLKK